MRVGVVGLGRMGSGIAARLRAHGHEVIGYDADGALSEVASLEALMPSLVAPRVVWTMVPAGAETQSVLDTLAGLLKRGDIVIDGGNSHYRDSVRRAQELGGRGISLLDAGTSGGVRGAESGFCLMVGGSRPAFDVAEPLFAALSPANGYAYLGPAGSGHFAKMVHNGIEYGLMEAYAEGFALLQASEFGFDLAALSRLWNSGSVVRSWLLELTAKALDHDQELEGLQAYVEDSGEGRWMVSEAVERGVPLPAISAALYERFGSREANAFALRLIAALRREFGGHSVRET